MAANGGGPPFIKKEQEFIDSNCNSISITDKNDYRGISIADRRAAKCGFNASNVNAATLSPPPYFTVPPGLSPSALLDSPVMLPNAEAQLSPTTGTFYPASNHDNLKLKLETCSSENNFMAEDNYKEFEYPKECLESSRDEMMLDDVKANKNAEDGFYWRKYGQKHVKGSEYPRSYYKCTNTNCPVTKKVERSHDGHIAEIVYKGHHNHPQPKQMPEPGHAAAAVSSSIHNQDLLFPESPESRVSLNEEAEAARKRKREVESAAVTRSTGREPKVVVQLESEVDILEDGYRWRKYGQKVVKGNPNPRSYYKCTTPNCPVRKHVERAANDIKSVITTYEGKHTHVVPSSRSGLNSEAAANPAAPSTKAAGKQLVQDLPLYLDREPMFNYTSLGGSAGDLSFGASSPYPLPFPPFHSMPYASVVPIKTSYSKLYPDYMPMPLPMPMSMPMPMPMPSPMPSSSSSSSSSHMLPFHYGGDATHQIQPKEEQDELYDTCLAMPNPPNGTM